MRNFISKAVFSLIHLLHLIHCLYFKCLSVFLPDTLPDTWACYLIHKPTKLSEYQQSLRKKLRKKPLLNALHAF